MSAVGLPRHERHLQGVIDSLSTIVYPGLTVEAVERHEEAPALVVHLIPGGWRDGTVGRPHDDAGVPVQVTCVGGTWQVTAYLWDLVEARLLYGPLVIEGRHRAGVAPHGGERQVKADTSVKPTVWTAKPVYLISTTPA